MNDQLCYYQVRTIPACDQLIPSFDRCSPARNWHLLQSRCNLPPLPVGSLDARRGRGVVRLTSRTVSSVYTHSYARSSRSPFTGILMPMSRAVITFSCRTGDQETRFVYSVCFRQMESSESMVQFAERRFPFPRDLGFSRGAYTARALAGMLHKVRIYSHFSGVG